MTPGRPGGDDPQGTSRSGPGEARDAGDEDGRELDPQESEHERLNRNLNELLQELRVSQTGVQILFAFLLGVAFTTTFADTTLLQRIWYFIALLSTAAGTALLIAPVAYHRLLFRQRSRPELVRSTNRFAIGGLVFTGLGIVAAVMLVSDVLLAHPWPWVVGGCLAAWFLTWWLVMPLIRRRARRTERRREGST